MAPQADAASTQAPDRAPTALDKLVERFDPSVIDVPTGSARIRLVVGGEGEWDAVISSDAIALQPAGDAEYPTPSSAPTRPPGSGSPATSAAA